MIVVYKFELWGAEGGYLGGKGGYTTGTLRIKHETMMYFFIGAKGPETIEVIGRTNPAYNGGGQAAAADTYRSAGSGGGSTDIRVDGETVYHRILVAAAGGGGSSHESGQFPGGSGGGLVGKNSSVFDPQYLSLGATQEGPGQGQEDYGGPSSYVTHSGIFGAGGYGTYFGTHGGGGSGWFGGAGGAPSAHSGGGGGSGYILTDTSYRPMGYEHKSSAKYYFNQGKTIDGDTPFHDCHTYEIVRGNKGNGCARITVLLPFTFQCRRLPFFFNSALIFICLFIEK